KTAKNFLAAAIFLELLKIFGELSSENQEKIKYSKWKATQIIKALKDGQIPTPGPPGGEADSLSDESVDNIPGIDQLPSDTSLDSSTIDSQSPFPTYHSTPNSVYHNVSPPNSDLHSGVHDLTSSLNQMDLNNNQQIPPNIPPKESHHNNQQFMGYSKSSLQSQNYVDIDPNTVSQAQKHCKWAISALNYNDVKTAVENIQKTLAMLEPYNQ
ncbi:2187_t:CDS:2, partial [Dentiscutata erythropus]